MSKFDLLYKNIFSPVDIASLICFRVIFGFIMLVEVWRYFRYGWIEKYYIRPEFYFKYYGFEWIEPWSGTGMYWHFAALGILAFLIMTGAFYRIASLLFLLGFTYVFLLDQTNYLNHFYLVILLNILLCVAPAHKAFSLDSWLFNPGIKSQTVPAWSVWAIRAQMEIMLVYAGLAKLNSDWLQLEPLSMWLATRADYPVVGYLFTQGWAVAIAAYGIILLHVVGSPLLLYSKTRPWIFALYIPFNVLNHLVFRIGIFPWLTLAGTLMFFEPDWPRRLIRKLKSLAGKPKAPFTSIDKTAGTPSMRFAFPQKAILFVFMVWFSVQILVPLRHVLYPGNVSWTEEGHRFSWRMKLRSKKAKARFIILDPATGKKWVIKNRDYLSKRQARKMPRIPDMILQFAHHLDDIWAVERGIPNVEVYATVKTSLNGRPYVLMINPDIDLAKIERNLAHANWILPLKVSLKEGK